ncbi:MAG: hypothetical protein RLN87_09255 [Parasphingopyxis sp.]|uniref:DUF6894 family protein n=1 Tax=Parasphingopyxis sp. TaxID=1920299 RepID=UPI0032EAF862
MNTFFFHFIDGERCSTDQDGLELANVEEAYLQTVAAARAMWPELLAERRDPRDCAFVVSVEGGEELFRLDFSELLESCGGAPKRLPRSSEIIDRLRETHLHASCVRADLHASYDEVYRSLAESVSLLAQFRAFERPASRKHP